MKERSYRIYVDVVYLQKKDETVVPLMILWEDGRKYRIDRILDRQIRPLENGIRGLRFSCVIQRQQRYLFREGDRWFVESPHPAARAWYEPDPNA
jgi:hypothetical protein